MFTGVSDQATARNHPERHAGGAFVGQTQFREFSAVRPLGRSPAEVQVRNQEAGINVPLTLSLTRHPGVTESVTGEQCVVLVFLLTTSSISFPFSSSRSASGLEHGRLSVGNQA